MEITGTIVNYYIHCKRQCYLFANKINLEDNEELVKIGRALHEDKLNYKENTEVELDSIKIDKLTREYLIEIKKSDADIEATKGQVYFYLSVLKKYGIERKGKIEFLEKNKDKKTIILELTPEAESYLEELKEGINELVSADRPPEKRLKVSSCKKCAYYAYCYI